jgi:1-acyl-sn-glycerol-3-phosphate acyltransferase
VFSAVSRNLLGFDFRLSASPRVSVERAIELLSASVSGGAVVVVNHQHAIDVIGLFEIWPVMERYLL